MFGKLAIFNLKCSWPILNIRVFQDVTENANWNKCLDVNGMSLARCIYSCKDNGDCETSCVEEFKSLTSDCPCEVGSIFINIAQLRNHIWSVLGELSWWMSMCFIWMRRYHYNCHFNNFDANNNNKAGAKRSGPNAQYRNARQYSNGNRVQRLVISSLFGNLTIWYGPYPLFLRGGWWRY